MASEPKWTMRDTGVAMTYYTEKGYEIPWSVS